MLSENTQYRAKRAQQLAQFLALINQNREQLLKKLKSASRESENCLIVSNVYHKDILLMLQQLAKDSEQAMEDKVYLGPVQPEELEKVMGLSQSGQRQALNYGRLNE